MSESPSVPGRVTNKQTRCALGGRLAFGPIGAWYGPFTKKMSQMSANVFFLFCSCWERERDRGHVSLVWVVAIVGLWEKLTPEAAIADSRALVVR